MAALSTCPNSTAAAGATEAAGAERTMTRLGSSEPDTASVSASESLRAAPASAPVSAPQSNCSTSVSRRIARAISSSSGTTDSACRCRSSSHCWRSSRVCSRRAVQPVASSAPARVTPFPSHRSACIVGPRPVEPGRPEFTESPSEPNILSPTAGPLALVDAITPTARFPHEQQ
jgi:hypothetical protein